MMGCCVFFKGFCHTLLFHVQLWEAALNACGWARGGGGRALAASATHTYTKRSARVLRLEWEITECRETIKEASELIAVVRHARERGRGRCADDQTFV